MSDQPDVADRENDQGGHGDRTESILARLRAAGIGEERARTWITSGAVRVDGETVDDPTAPAPWPTPWTLTSP